VLPPLADIYRAKGVELRGCAATRTLLGAEQEAWLAQTLAQSQAARADVADRGAADRDG